MSKLNEYFVRDGLFSNILKVILGTGFARLIGVISIPILTRLYSPEDYGVLAIFLASIAILAPFLTLRYVTAIPLPRNDTLALYLVFICFVLIVFLGILWGVILFIFSDKIFDWLDVSSLISWWWLIVLGSIVVALYELLSLWATREKEYSLIAKNKVMQSIFGEITKIILGVLSIKPFGLLLGNVVEQGSGITSFYLLLRKKIGLLKIDVGYKFFFFLLKYYRAFPIYRMPSQFLLVFSMQAPAIFSAALFGKGVTGQLSLALMALALPVSIIGNSVGQVFYGEIAKIGKKSSNQIKRLAYQVQKKLFIVGIPLTVFIFFFGEFLFKICFGEKWSEAGNFASILAPYLLLQLTSAPLIQVLNIYNSQLGFLLINLVRTIGLIAIYFVFLKFDYDAEKFIATLSLFLFMFYLFVTIYIVNMLNSRAKKQGF